MLTIKDLGEHQLLAKLSKFCAENIVGDDAALLDFPANKKLVVTTDILVENVHFSDRTTPPLAIGWRAVSANLSDLAAMGATPKGITVGLSLRGETTVEWIETVYQGMKQCLDQFDTAIVGGDITKSNVNTISITALGEVSPQQTILRHVAQVGDFILITGKHGLSKAGLELLLNPEKYSNISSGIQTPLIKAHQYPQPRFDVIQQLQKLNWCHPIAGMDSSDGLADAIMQICQLSQVGAEIYLDKIPIDNNIISITNATNALEWCLYGGEDFELILCLPSSLAEELRKNLNSNAVIIGKIIESQSLKLIKSESSDSQILLSKAKTYQHF